VQLDNGPGFTAVDCTFEVPDAPKFVDQTFFLWCGVQQANANGPQSFGVLQPVLMYGGDCPQYEPNGKIAKLGPGAGYDPTYNTAPYWYYSAQYIYETGLSAPSPQYACHSGPLFKAVVGESLTSGFKFDPITDVMTVWMTGRAGTSNLIVAHPRDNPALKWSSYMTPNRIFALAVVEANRKGAPWPALFSSARGWNVATSITSKSVLTQAQKSLKPAPGGSLVKSCKHPTSPIAFKSTCTYKTK